MKTISTIYHNKKQLQSFIEKNELNSTKNLLIQVYTGESKVRVSRLHASLTDLLPKASIIGATVDASFCDEIKTSETTVSFTVFEKTQINSLSVPYKEEMPGFQYGLEIGKHIIEPETKVVILFGNSHTIDKKEVLRALETHHPTVNVAGGNAVPLGEKNVEFLIANEGLIDIGLVAISLTGAELKASVHACSEWNTAGRSFEVTKAEGTTVHELNHLPVRSIYEKYLGVEMTRNIAESHSSFPLMVSKGNKTRPAMVRSFNSDGSIEVMEPIQSGSDVSIGCGDAGIFLDSINFIYEQLKNRPVEGLFLYSCLSRRRFFKKGIDHEMDVIKSLIPTTAAFTAGEYVHKEGKNELLSYALTFLSLAENESYIDEGKFLQSKSSTANYQEFLALSHLIKASTEDLEELNYSLEESEQKYKSLFEHNPDIVYSVETCGRITSVNASLERILGYSTDDVLGKNVFDLVSSEEVDRIRPYFQSALKDKTQNFTMIVQHKTGKDVLLEVAIMPIKVKGKVIGVYGVAKNLTEQRMAEKKIMQLAYHDSLTGLPNRKFFHERLTGAIKIASRLNEQLAVLVVDLDEFKMINDSLGHQAGDRILKQIARNMGGMIENGQFLARFTADEFLIFVPRAENLESITELAKRMLSVIKKPIFLNGKEYVLSASIGISMYPEDAINDELLLKNANLAMHRAKLNGRNSVQFFTDEMNDTVNERLEMENHLRQAMALDEFEVFYQPQLNISDGGVFACEALLRWNHTKQGMIPPNQFIPVAEETGLINEIGLWVLQKACQQARSWIDQGLKDLAVCVNVSGKQFQRMEFVEEVKQCLNETGLEASALHLELTESIMLEDVDHSLWTINQLRSLGVKVSVDDFGTGYSSLSYLRDFPIDILKIDQSFIRNLEEFSSDAAIVRAIITMCEGLNVTVLAEGVETKKQLDTLKKFGCNQVQGYYISKPVQAAKLNTFLKKEKVI